jgi:hypothetical protein
VTVAERNGFANPRALQIESMDEVLQRSLWICLEDLFDDLNREAGNFDTSQARYREFLGIIWTEFFKYPRSKLILLNAHHIVHSAIKPLFDKLEWDKVYDLLEFMALLLKVDQSKEITNSFIDRCNYILKRESSGWRFVETTISPITEPSEIQSIEDARTEVGKETAKHLYEALQFLSQKGEKNYRGCGRAAIDALEAFAQEVTGEYGKTLSDLCNKRKLPLHPVKQKSIQHLYDYASDRFRHAEKPSDEEITYHDAIEMLLQCTSLINLIKSKRKGKIS